MSIHPLAGKPAPTEVLVDITALEKAYYQPFSPGDDPPRRVSFGTSGHRGSPLDATFTEAHILAITQAICDYRAEQGDRGPILVGKDTHAISAPAERTALEVLAGNGVETWVQAETDFTPTPAISRAILAHNRGRRGGLADGIVVTPSHNPPADGGFKYNPPHGGPADTGVTRRIEERANRLLAAGNREVRRLLPTASAATIRRHDFMTGYVEDLAGVIDLDLIRSTGVTIGVDPLGGAALAYWQAIAERWGLAVTVVNAAVDPRFAFMTLDHDGQIRMDCSSPWAMANLVGLKDRFQIAVGNDADADRHGIVTPSGGLMNPNHYLAVAIRYLLGNRPEWPGSSTIGKTVVSSCLIDRVVESSGRHLLEVPVGFKWFAEGLLDGSLCFAGEESAGGAFGCRDGSAWTTDKDGILLGLLAAELTARSGRDPGAWYEEIVAECGRPHYARTDIPASAAQKRALAGLGPEAVAIDDLAGEPVLARLTRAPGNGAAIGGLKVTTAGGWFAVRPSGTEDVCKIYAESLRSEDHLRRIQDEAFRVVQAVFASTGDES